jgi:hypothetical protein
MKEPKKIRLTDLPRCKSVDLIPLPSIDAIYPETMNDDVNTSKEINQILKKTDTNEEFKQNNLESK